MVTMNNKIIEIEFTEELLEKWTKLYFKEHPRAKKRPIKNPSHPSINEWCVLKRQAMNSLKQNWKSFTIFVIEYYGLQCLNIKKCKCKYIVYRDTKRRRDCDNITPKFLWDGLTEGDGVGLLKDDSCDCITELTLSYEYKKGIKGARLIFYDCEY